MRNGEADRLSQWLQGAGPCLEAPPVKIRPICYIGSIGVLCCRMFCVGTGRHQLYGPLCQSPHNTYLSLDGLDYWDILLIKSWILRWHIHVI